MKRSTYFFYVHEKEGKTQTRNEKENGISNEMTKREAKSLKFPLCTHFSLQIRDKKTGTDRETDRKYNRSKSALLTLRKGREGNE